MARLDSMLAVLLLARSPQVARPECSENSSIPYVEKWSASGLNFFDQFWFEQEDFNHGATHYLNRLDALRLGVAQPSHDHAVLRAGPRSQWNLKRTSAKIYSKPSWHYFLAAVRFTHVPYGCGVWPAFWTTTPTEIATWPNGGELDILEYANDLPSQTSFHTGERNPCHLSAEEVAPAGCPAMPDLNNMNYNCNTSYPSTLGCAPNRLPTLPGALWAQKPGVMAFEWTASFVKIFYIPEDELANVGLDGEARGTPQPDTWDDYLLSYYPFAASERRRPGSCRNPAEVMLPQQLVFNIAFCGDWAGKVWDQSPSCNNRVGPAFPDECSIVDPLAPLPEGVTIADDCCTKYVWDEEGAYGTDQAFEATAFWNFTWVKVWQDGRGRYLRGQPLSV
eukprot:TRINITY_DN108649_c0_g1_i1.p1 TRINITY_DN108649_c0_g1~~TRINITY_DN108649_c0_g1_i1.p1  ORF type:complete len:392 (-),score=70.39 TRINITY_DN108649_c0_g1_i1:35-1210(-)